MITVYTTPTCGFCHMLKDYLSSKNIDFTEKDITTDSDALEWVDETIGQRVTPITNIDGEVVVGFEREQIDNILRAKKLL